MNIIIFLIFITFLIGFVQYIEVKEIAGYKTARIIALRDSFCRLLLCLAPLLLIWKLSWVTFSILYSLSISIWCVWMLSRFLGKRKAGILLLDLGRNEKSRPLFWLGLLVWTPLAVFFSWSFFEHAMQGFSEDSLLGVRIVQLANIWLLSLSSFAFGLCRLEFREDGIYLPHLVSWRRIEHVTWKKTNSKILKILLKGRYPLSQRMMTIVIPVKHQDAVGDILNERVPSYRP